MTVAMITSKQIPFITESAFWPGIELYIIRDGYITVGERSISEICPALHSSLVTVCINKITRRQLICLRSVPAFWGFVDQSLNTH